MSTSCGIWLSWLSKWIVKGLSAGAVSVETLNLMPDATSAIPPGPPDPPGAPDPPGPPYPVGAPEPPGPAVPPAAERGGNQPAVSATEATRSTAKIVISVRGQPGAGPFSI